MGGLLVLGEWEEEEDCWVWEGEGEDSWGLVTSQSS